MISTDVQKLQAGSIIDLYEIDATAIGGTVLRWCSDVNELKTDIVWQGETYTRFPIIVDGFARSGRGTQPRPTIKASNVAGVLGALVREFNDLVGAKFTRKRTFVKYLDAVNFAADYDKSVNRERVNLLSYSEEFDNSTWNSARVIEAADQTTAPNGSTTADKIIEDTQTGAHHIYDEFIGLDNLDYTYSVFLKPAEHTRSAIYINNQVDYAGAFFDLSSGTIISTNSGATSSIYNAGNGWYRCVISRDVETMGSSPRVHIFLVEGETTTTNYTGDGVSGIYAWGAQMELGSTATEYQSVGHGEGENPSADSNVGFADEVWYVDRKASEDGIFISFELASAMDLTNAKLPKRQITQNTCAWQYRSAECSYSGGAVANIMDVATGVLADDVCGHRVESCKLRFGDKAELPYGGFPGSSN
jgi:lambda family phage minor tail protein L